MADRFLTLDDVLGIHQDLIDAFGGSPGLRDHGGLEAAVMRPQSGYYLDVIAEAAALWESLSQIIRSWMATSAPQLQQRLPISASTATRFGWRNSTRTVS